jgi:hypothetical protein
LVEQSWELLHFIDDYQLFLWAEPVTDQFGTLGEFAEDVGFKEIVVSCFWKGLAEECSLPDLPRAEQK